MKILCVLSVSCLLCRLVMLFSGLVGRLLLRNRVIIWLLVVCGNGLCVIMLVILLVECISMLIGLLV